MANEKDKKAPAEAEDKPKMVRATALESFADGAHEYRRGAVVDVPQDIYDRNESRFEKGGDAPKKARQAGTSDRNQQEVEVNKVEKPKAKAAAKKDEK